MVNWKDETQTVTVAKDDKQIFLQIGSNILNKNGERIQFDVPAKLLNGRTLVTVRSVSEAIA